MPTTAQLPPLGLQKEGNEAVVQALTKCGALLKEEMYAHKYPYDWRTKKPTIFRWAREWGGGEGALRPCACSCPCAPCSFRSER